MGFRRIFLIFLFLIKEKKIKREIEDRIENVIEKVEWVFFFFDKRKILLYLFF